MKKYESIELDEHCEKIITNILEQSKQLIEINYWDNITIAKLNNWFENFDTKIEKYLAAVLLHKLIFRSKEATIALGKNIFHLILPKILEDNDIYQINDIQSWLKDLDSTQDARNLPFRISAISNVDLRPVKSSSIIYNTLEDNFFDKNLGWGCDHFEKLPEKIKSIILFDDIIGTGEQFEKFYLERKLNESKLKVIYIPFAAVTNSYNLLNDKYDNLVIHPVEKITDNHNFFSTDNRLINKDDIFCSESFKELYLDFCKRKNINLKDKLGKGELALTYMFSNSTPNNNLAVLWHKDDNWHTLFKR